MTTGAFASADGGSSNGFDSLDDFRGNNRLNWSQPYAEHRNVHFEVGLMYGRPNQQCVNTCTDPSVPGNDCNSSHWSSGCALQTSERYHWLNVVGDYPNNVFDLRSETSGGIDKQVITELDVYIWGGVSCNYNLDGKCDQRPDFPTDNNGYQELSEIKFYGEIYEDSISSQEVQLGILLRSPKEHGNVDRPYSQAIGDFTVSKNDKYLRDNFTTSATMRNVYYQSQ